MASIAPPPQRDTLEQSLLTHLQVPEPALRALRRARELERELMLLRGALNDSSTLLQPKTSKHEQVANLLSRVVLFRIALADPPMQNVTLSGSDRATEQM